MVQFIVTTPFILLLIVTSQYFTLLHGFQQLVYHQKNVRTTARFASTTRESSTTTSTATAHYPSMMEGGGGGQVDQQQLTHQSISHLRYRELKRQLQVRGEADLAGTTTAELRKRLRQHVPTEVLCTTNDQGEEVCEEDMMNVCTYAE